MAKATKTEVKAKKSIFTLNDGNRKKLRYIAAIEERSQQDIVNEALAEWVTKYEKKNGAVAVK